MFSKSPGVGLLCTGGDSLRVLISPQPERAGRQRENRQFGMLRPQTISAYFNLFSVLTESMGWVLPYAS